MKQTRDRESVYFLTRYLLVAPHIREPAPVYISSSLIPEYYALNVTIGTSQDGPVV